MRLNSVIVNLNTLAYGTVFQTQVVNWIRHIERRGVSVYLVLTEPLVHLFSKKSRYNLEFIKSRISSSVHHIYAARPSVFLSQVLLAWQLSRLIHNNVDSDKIIILQTRSSLYVTALMVLKAVFRRRLKIVFDSRGASAEEMIYQKIMDASLRRRYDRALKSERRMIALSDIVLCVSRKLISYHIEKTCDKITKFHVNSCNADNGLFFYNAELRETGRRAFGIGENERVFVYSGGMDMKWHIPGELFKLFEIILTAIPNSIICILTKDQIPVEFLSLIDIGRTIMKAVENEDINQYLNMADFGIIIREDIPLNRVASPTKFAEYMLAGLPVMISHNLGDFSDVVIKHGFGVQVSVPLEKDKTIEALHHLIQMGTDRAKIASFGNENYSKEAAVDRIIGVYKDLEYQ